MLLHQRSDRLFNSKQAAERAGITEALLHLWVSTGKVKPTMELSTRKHNLSGLSKGALESFAPEGHRFIFQFNYAAVEELRRMVEHSSEKKAKSESDHVKGSHYTVQELASLWGFGVDKIREMFENEPDVLKIQSPTKRGKRPYSSLRIPEAVAARVQRRNSL
jgi:hypothetical protein